MAAHDCACEPMWPHGSKSNSPPAVLPLWNHFLLFLTSPIQKTNAKFSIHYTSEEQCHWWRGRGFIFQCIAGAWVIPHDLKCWWGSSCCMLWVKELWNALKVGYCGQGGAPDDLMQYEEKRKPIKTPACTMSAFHIGLYHLFLILHCTVFSALLLLSLRKGRHCGINKVSLLLFLLLII